MTVSNNLILDFARKPETWAAANKEHVARQLGTTVEEIEKRIAAVPPEPEELIDVAKPPRPPSDDIYSGLVGDFVRLWEPHAESNNVALAAQFLVAFGQAVGSSPFFAVSGTDHRVNLQVCLVGPSSTGSKGDSLDCVTHTFDKVALQSGETVLNIKSGMSTGEGLIAAVRDRATGSDKRTGRRSSSRRASPTSGCWSWRQSSRRFSKDRSVMATHYRRFCVRLGTVATSG
jgi:hypothetical protein